MAIFVTGSKKTQPMNFYLKSLITTCIIASVASVSFAQQADSTAGKDTTPEPLKYERLTYGLGLGIDYGGIGMNIGWFPMRNLGFSFGAGYAFSGVGVNAGLRARLLSPVKRYRANPFLFLIYGYNAAVYVENKREYNKMYYGLTLGGGVEVRTRRPHGYFSLGAVVPFLDSDLYDYIDELETYHNADFKNKPQPVNVTIGYRWIFL